MSVQIKDLNGIRCWFKGDVKDLRGTELAMCVAQLVHLQQLWAAQKQ
jgi:hypothetical protein